MSEQHNDNPDFYPDGPYVETYSGRKVGLVNPRPDHISSQDLAISLSRQVRYKGHTQSKIPVAAHSVWVMWQVLRANGGDPEAGLHALLHDAHEAYLGDMPSPLKNIPAVAAAWKPLEQNLDRVIALRYKLAPMQPEWQENIRYYDALALAIEARDQMASGGAGWVLPEIPAGSEYSQALDLFDENAAFAMFNLHLARLLRFAGRAELYDQYLP